MPNYSYRYRNIFLLFVGLSILVSAFCLPTLLAQTGGINEPTAGQPVSSEHVKYLIIFRGIERLIAQVGGLMSVVLGTLLFKWGVSGKASLAVQSKGVKFSLINASPGILFCLFGMAVIAWGITHDLNIGTTASAVQREIAVSQQEKDTQADPRTSPPQSQATTQPTVAETITPRSDQRVQPHPPAKEREVTSTSGIRIAYSQEDSDALKSFLLRLSSLSVADDPATCHATVDGIKNEASKLYKKVSSQSKKQ